MKRYLISILVYFTFIFCPQVYSQQKPLFSEDVLINAFENGCSLAIAEIYSVYNKKSHGTRMYYYKAKVLQTIIFGDLALMDISNPIDLFAGASYGKTLKTYQSPIKNKSIYAIFITKDSPKFFSWAHRDNFLEINNNDSKTIEIITDEAKQAYKKTSICKFRQSIYEKNPSLPTIPESVIKAAKKFRENPTDRAKFAKIIFESDLGSRPDPAQEYLSYRKDLPPKIPLSRTQLIHLLGEPTLKSGWVYFWFCGKDENNPYSNKYIGILSATFSKDEIVVYLLYNWQKKQEWE